MRAGQRRRNLTTKHFVLPHVILQASGPDVKRTSHAHMVDDREAPLGAASSEALSLGAEAVASAPGASAVPLAPPEKSRAAAVAPVLAQGAPAAGGRGCESSGAPASQAGRHGPAAADASVLRHRGKISRVCAPIWKVCLRRELAPARMPMAAAQHTAAGLQRARLKPWRY